MRSLLYVVNSGSILGLWVAKMAPDPGSPRSSIRNPLGSKRLSRGCEKWASPRHGAFSKRGRSSQILRPGSYSILESPKPPHSLAFSSLQTVLLASGCRRGQKLADRYKMFWQLGNRRQGRLVAPGNLAGVAATDLDEIGSVPTAVPAAQRAGS